MAKEKSTGILFLQRNLQETQATQHLFEHYGQVTGEAIRQYQKYLLPSKTLQMQFNRQDRTTKKKRVCSGREIYENPQAPNN